MRLPPHPLCCRKPSNASLPVGSTLVELLAADARAGGITHLTVAIPDTGEVVDLRRQAAGPALLAALDAA